MHKNRFKAILSLDLISIFFAPFPTLVNFAILGVLYLGSVIGLRLLYLLRFNPLYCLSYFSGLF